VLHDVSASEPWVYLRSVTKWTDIPLLLALQPATRALLHSQWWWRRSHPVALAAGAGTLLAGVGVIRRDPAAVVVGAALGLPYVRFRSRVEPIGRTRAERLRSLPVILLADLLEIAVMVRGSVRYRTLVL